MVLYKNRTGKYLVYFQIFYVLFYNLLISMLGFPSSISYLTDLVTAVLFVLAFKKISKTFKKINYFAVITLIFMYISYLVVVDISNLVSPMLVFWAFRNNFRLIVFFICCVCFLDKEDINKIMKMLYKVSWINFAFVLIQHFVFGYSQDNLGGIFGTLVGCNGGLNLYCCIILTYFTCHN